MIASNYDDSGPTASTLHFPLGFAATIYGGYSHAPWGKKVTFCRADPLTKQCASPQVVGVLQDLGPFVTGRTFDFNQALKNALGCGGLCDVLYSAG